MNQVQAIAQVQAQNVGMFIVLFGEACNGYDIGVYKSEADSDADVADNGNDRLVDRVTVAIASQDSPLETEIARLSDGALAPKFMAIALDETSDWNENAPGYARAIALSGGAIFATYFYNARSITNLCEVTASYELHRVDTIGNIRSSYSEERYEATEEDREWLDEWLAIDEHDSIIDVYCNVIDGIALEYGRHQLIEDLATRPLEELQELDAEGAIDEMAERQSGNPTIC